MRVRDETPLLRIVPKTMYQAGRISHRLFRPRRDETDLSAYNGDMITPEQALQYYTNGGDERLQVVAINAGSVWAEGVDIIEDSGDNGFHVSLSFANLDVALWNDISKLLASKSTIVLDIQ